MFGRVMRQASDWNRFHGRPSQGDADFLLQIRALMRYDHATFQKANTSVGVLNTCVNPPTAPSKRANRGNLTEPDLQTRHFRPVAACMGSYGLARLKDREFPSRSGHSEVLRELVFPGFGKSNITGHNWVPDMWVPFEYFNTGTSLPYSNSPNRCLGELTSRDVPQELTRHVAKESLN